MKRFELLEELVRQNSYTRNKLGVNKLGEIIKNELDFMQCDTYTHPERGDLIVFNSQETNTSYPKIVLSGHLDTVHSEESEMYYKVEGDKIWGQGIHDMKAGLFVIINVLKMLYKNGALINVSCIFTPDEELQSVAYREQLDKLFTMHDIGLVYEPTMQISGTTSFSEDVRSIVVARKGQGRYRFRVTGPGGHSGVITQRNARSNAIEEAAHTIVDLEKLSDYDKGTTVNVGHITGGTSFNVIAEECIFEGDYRVVTKEEHERLQKEIYNMTHIKRIDGVKKEFSFLTLKPPMEEQGASDHKAILHTVANEMNITLHEEHRGGASDANEMAYSGLTVFDGMGVQGEGEHTQQEFVYIDSIDQSIDFSYNTITKLQKTHE